MNEMQLSLDALEAQKRKLGRKYDKFPSEALKKRYNACEDGIRRLISIDPSLERRSKEYYL